MPRTKKKSVCIYKHMPILSDNDDSDSDSVDNLANAEQPDSEEVLTQKLLESKRRVLRLSHLLVQKMS